MGQPLARLALCLLLAGACATTQQTRSVEKSGFLDDYSALGPGKGGEAQLIYVDSEADFSRYTKVLLEPVTIWHEEGSDLSDVPHEDLQLLADRLYAAISRELATAYSMTGQPGPDALRIRVAITEARGSSVALDMVSTVLPQMRVISAGKRLATGTHAFVGRTAIEGEVLDAASGERLLAAVDERAGGKALRGSTSTWDDALEAYQYWAERLALRLKELRERPTR